MRRDEFSGARIRDDISTRVACAGNAEAGMISI